ncbi:MAG: alpha/beta hydrolase [Lachnospiraceae bacterium]|nr:alpha/beta hydrolase [Lachnospiraceae bacterium]
MENLIIKSKDGTDISLSVYEIPNAKGVVQVIHGMMEHKGRYEKLANELNKAGYSVVTSDLRGHGKAAETLGFFKEKNGHKELIRDQKIITKYIFKRFGVNKVNIFAHSFGTIIARNLLQTESHKYKSVILSGYPAPAKEASAGIILSNIIMTFKGANAYSPLIEKMSVGTFNSAVDNPRTEADWLSVNEKNVDEYMKDPYCGFGFTVSAFNDLFRLVKNMRKPELYKNVDSYLPILCIGGAQDPCIDGVRGSNASIYFLHKAGFKNIKRKTFENMRHEILNEHNNGQVYKTIISFINKNNR